MAGMGARGRVGLAAKVGMGWVGVAGKEAMVKVAEGGWVAMGGAGMAEKVMVESGERGCSRRGGQSRRQGVRHTWKMSPS